MRLDVDDRTALLLAWLEGEEERQRRPILPPPRAKDPALRGWVQVGVCALVGAVAAALFVCWLAPTWNLEKRVNTMEELRQMGFRRATGASGRPGSMSRWGKEGGATTRRNDDAIGAFLCIMFFAIPLGTVIGAVFLREACTLYNKLADGTGSPSSVPELSLGKAMGISFATTVVNAVARFAIGLLGAGGAARGPVVIAQLLSIPVGLLVLAGLNTALLPTTFARGLSIALCYVLVALFVFGVLAVILGGLLLVGFLLR